MYNIRLDAYIPQPNPATVDRIVAAHYYPAWKYGAAQVHNGFNDLAEAFPGNTPLMGYYDEENPEVCDWEIKWAVEHGINCFIHCWYRKKANEGKPVTVSDLRCGHGLHEALFNAKYQQYMKFAIMFEVSPRWGGTDKDDIIDNLMPFWMENYFKRGNYLIFDNKPVLFIYEQERLSAEGFQDPAVQLAAFDACREYAKREGFDGMIFAAQCYQPTKETDAEYKARGYDFVFSYTSGYNAAESYPEEEKSIEGQMDLLEQRLALDPMRYTATASAFRDSTPRCTPAFLAISTWDYRKDLVWYLTPDGFRKVLRLMKQRTDALPEGAWGRRIFMIDNWNEWDEGHYVAPSHNFGFKYLQAIREELTARDNLPDYRMPQDMGFTGYNKSWVTPDFSEFCAKKLAEQTSDQK